MKHLQTFEQLNEGGIINTIKEMIFPSTYRINYKVEHPKSSKKGKEDREGKDGKYRPLSKTVDIKAKDADDAESKFQSMVDKELKNADPKPTVTINSVYKTKKVQYKNLRIF